MILPSFYNFLCYDFIFLTKHINFKGIFQIFQDLLSLHLFIFYLEISITVQKLQQVIFNNFFKNLLYPTSKTVNSQLWKT